MAYVFVLSFVLITIAELADKSQLLALGLAARYKAWQVLLGIFVATFVVSAAAVLIGQSLGAIIPTGVLPWVTGPLFIGFGVWTLRGDGLDAADSRRAPAGRFGPVVATAIAFFFAELGDKTQIMTLTIAADPGTAIAGYLSRLGLTGLLGPTGASGSGMPAASRFWAVTLGSTLGMVAADAVAIGVGRLMGARMPEKTLHAVSGGFLILFGVLTLVSAFV